MRRCMVRDIPETKQWPLWIAWLCLFAGAFLIGSAVGPLLRTHRVMLATIGLVLVLTNWAIGSVWWALVRRTRAEVLDRQAGTMPSGSQEPSGGVTKTVTASRIR